VRLKSDRRVFSAPTFERGRQFAVRLGTVGVQPDFGFVVKLSDEFERNTRDFELSDDGELVKYLFCNVEQPLSRSLGTLFNCDSFRSHRKPPNQPTIFEFSAPPRKRSFG
jgi:hypothetical protein